MYDYIFYRVYIYYKRNNDSTPIFQACGITTFIIFLNLFDIYSLFDYFFLFNPPYTKIIIGVFTGILLLIVWYRYNSNAKIGELKNRFSNESIAVKKRKKILILIYAIFSMSIPLIISNLKGQR